MSEQHVMIRRWNSPPSRLPIPDKETRREAGHRQYLDKKARAEWDRWSGQRCAQCGHVRTHVTHESDPATSFEGPDYYASFLDELHEFVEPPS